MQSNAAAEAGDNAPKIRHSGGSRNPETRTVLAVLDPGFRRGDGAKGDRFFFLPCTGVVGWATPRRVGVLRRRLVGPPPGSNSLRSVSPPSPLQGEKDMSRRGIA